ncbi:MAG: HAD family hydrolase [Actinomycetota bacterium]
MSTADRATRIAAVTFDADQTLWDFAGVMERALGSTITEMEQAGDIEPGSMSPDDLRMIRDEIAAAARGEVHDLEEVRRRSFAEALRRAGHPDPTTRSRELTAHYLDIRFTAIRMYDDVRPALTELQTRWPIGLLTNGNTDPERCGLPGVFDAVVMGPDHGIEKPDRRAFELISERLGAAPSALLHVGDDADDIDGANGVGAVSVLIERDGPRLDLRGRADHVISTLDDLKAIIATS